MDQLKWCSDNTGSLNREVSTSDQNGGGQQALADWQVLCRGGGANGDHRRGQVDPSHRGHFQLWHWHDSKLSCTELKLSDVDNRERPDKSTSAFNFT